MKIRAIISVFEIISTGLNKTIKEIKNRRVHVWAAFYFIGIWNFLEPMITYFGLSQQLIEVFRNIGIAIFPLVIIAAWFHGEPGTQKFKKTEGVLFIIGVLCTGTIFKILNHSPAGNYTLIAPFSIEKREFFKKNILREFEKTYNVNISVKTPGASYPDDLFSFFSTQKETSDVLLVQVPLSFTGILLNEQRESLMSFNDILDDEQHFTSLVSHLDDSAIRFGRDQIGDGKLYFLPSEFQLNMLLYSKSKVQQAVDHWQVSYPEMNKQFQKITGEKFPRDYCLEADPNLWDDFDLFFVTWFWKNGLSHGGEGSPRYAIPSSESFELFSYLLDRALCHGTSLDQFFNLHTDLNKAFSASMVLNFYWDLVLKNAGLFYREMWLGKGMRAGEIAEGLKLGKLYMAILPNDYIQTVIHSNQDIHVATLPFGNSLSRVCGTKEGYYNIWYYAIPKSSPSYDMSIRLADWLTRDINQFVLSNKLLLAPSNKALLSKFKNNSDSSSAFPKPIIDQLQIDQKNSAGTVNPYKDFLKVDYDIMMKYHYNRWVNIIKEENTLQGNYQTDLENILKQITMPLPYK